MKSTTKAVKQPHRTAWNSTLRPSTKPMKRTGWIERSRKPLKTRKVSKRFAHHRCQPFLDWLKSQPCFVTGLRTGAYWMLSNNGGWVRIVVDPAHLVKGRGAGAYDLGFALPLAHHLHDAQHGVNGGIKTFRRRHGLTEEGVKQIAELYATEWRATQTEEQ